MSEFTGPLPLVAGHTVEGFDCGKEALNAFLVRHAKTNQANGSSRTFAVLGEGRVVAYYSLAASAVVHEEAPERMAKGLARHPIPAILMARFAVDLRFQGKGLGSAMFKDALRRSFNVAGEIGARAFVVHAKDEEARKFYGQRFGMQAFLQNPLHLYLLMKDVARLIT